MSEPELTISQLRHQLRGTPQEAGLDYALAQDHTARLDAVQKAVDFACNQLEQYKHRKQNLGEDAITLEICSMLNMLGFQAAHDTDVGGHCDIVIKGIDLFLWLAEAKEHSNYSWLDKGFKQLSTRYSTGVLGQDHGEILIYCYTANAKQMIETWRAELENRNSDVATENSSCGNPLVFDSTHKHASSGLNFYIRHKALALHWSPKDK